MAIPYPLYDDLVKKVEMRKEKNIDINRICSTINNIERAIVNPGDSMSEIKEKAYQHYREINMLICYHHILTTGIENPIPYDNKVMVGGKGVLNHVNNHPALLQQIIAQYIEEETNN